MRLLNQNPAAWASATVVIEAARQVGFCWRDEHLERRSASLRHEVGIYALEFSAWCETQCVRMELTDLLARIAPRSEKACCIRMKTNPTAPEGVNRSLSAALTESAAPLAKFLPSSTLTTHNGRIVFSGSF